MSGEGKAAEFLSLEPYREFIEIVEGISPYPGTLNLEVDPEKVEQFRSESDKHRMEATEHEGKELGGLDLHEARINGEKCYIVDPDLTRHGKDIVEIVASSNLREMFDLEDGDTVKIQKRD